MAQNKRGSYKKSPAGKSKGTKRNSNDFNEELINEITMIVIIAVAICLFLCNFGILGGIGNVISSVMFGLFGLLAYIFPPLAAYIIFFSVANQGNPKALRRSFGLIFLDFSLSMIFELVWNMPNVEGDYSAKQIYLFAAANHKAGGFFGGSLAFFAVKALGIVGCVLVVLVIFIICIVLITEKSFVKGVRSVSDSSKRAIEESTYNAQARYEQRALRKAQAIKNRNDKLEERRIQKESEENDKILKMKEVSGVPTYSFTKEEPLTKDRDDIHEINLNDLDSRFEERKIDIKIHGVFDEDINNTEYSEEDYSSDAINEINVNDEDDIIIPGTMDAAPVPVIKSTTVQEPVKPVPSRKSKVNRPYKFPPIDLLKKGVGSKTTDKSELMQTAQKLEEVLASFNVNAKVNDVSQGPTVTRYEMTPQTGVKVSKILSLADDIKLNLAAADIRIEAPIPGKAAIGIEVPNKEAVSVSLRELLESKEFKNSESKISFAVGKDLAGKTIVADIAKMPHMLIAGATGSGKSVCINTLIMSILYKAKPDEVKMILIDPKVVELSVYNGIPHLLIPVVTDPKKANASLQWAVREMDDRYRKFAEMGVRDLKGYNEKIKDEVDAEGKPMPLMYKLVVIVDELADLMMVAGKEVEESICRLAQLARAAGIHLIIATQRPSVDVITGLIKANMPSRVAFSVTSGVDSRTILDMVGAEKLLGKGDMLFYPQGYTKPARVQGAFVSDKEVNDVVEFINNNSSESYSNEEIQNAITHISSEKGNKSDSKDGSGFDNSEDEFFEEAGRLITQSGKSSIGMLQRKFKIGFNRAARIMDALADANVVGPEEGTKPRTILMTPEEFEEYINNH